jgi:hypothetical protein
MIAYCGLNCLKCDGYIATQSGDELQIAEVAKKWSQLYSADIKPEHVVCHGCKSNEQRSFHCTNLCEIRKCAVSRGLDTCAECGDYSCENLEVILNCVPEAKENLDKLKK